MKSKNEIALLQNIPLFADLPQDQLSLLASALTRRVYPKGELILRQGEPGDSLFVVVTGQVRIYTLSPEGRELSVWIYGPGDFFGEMALLTGQPRSASAEAMRRTEVLALRRQTFQQHLLSNPQAALRIIESLSQRLRGTTESFEGLASLSVPQRVARKLLDLAEHYGIEQDNGILIDMDLSQEAVASLVGATRESANRALSNLRDQGMVQVDRVRILITHPDELRKLVDEEGR